MSASDSDHRDLIEVRADLSRMIASLPPRQAKLLELRYFQGMAEKEIAQRLGISVRSVSRILGSARRQLRSQAERNSGQRHLPDDRSDVAVDDIGGTLDMAGQVLRSQAGHGMRRALAMSGERLQVVTLLSDGAYAIAEGDERINAVVHFVCARAGRLLDAIHELEWLINCPEVREDELQRFFEKHPEFLLGTEYRQLHPQLVLQRTGAASLIPDFILEPVTTPLLCDLIDLKLPQVEIATGGPGRHRLAHSVGAAVAQLREYRQWFDDPRHRDDAMRLYGVSAYMPTAAVIIGRDPERLSPQEFQALRQDISWLKVMTYDDIVRRGRALASRLLG